MRTFSVTEIMSMRDMYKEPPYPNFSLDEVLRKRAACGTTLTRGENAWSVAAPTGGDEGIVRMVRSSLNKIAPEKYQEVLKDLSIPSLIASERAMQLVIDLIFRKALQEPGYSEMYARLCYDMAMYEVKLQQANGSSTAASPQSQAGTPVAEGSVAKRTSKFREQIVRSAQKEFQLTSPDVFANLSGEELDEARASVIRRKKANITFVGQLYVHRVLSPSIMFTIIHTVLRTSDRPQEIDIEVLGALLETVGKTLDRDANRRTIDTYFAQLQSLLDDVDNPYPMRIRFKLMNIIDLRKSDWEPRVTRADNQAPTTLQEQENKQQPTAATLKPLGPRSPTISTPTARRGGSGMQRFPSTSQFPDSPQPGPAPPSLATWRNVSAPQRETPMAYTPADIARRRGAKNETDLPFDKRVKAMLTEWVNERSNEAIPQWKSRFKTAEFDRDEDLCRAIVAEVVRDACITTKRDAQREACSFLRVGLSFEPDDSALSRGLVDTLVKALEEGIKEDVPKFFERFVSILHLVTEKETIVELYCDAAKLVYLVYQEVEERSEETLELLLEVWQLLPHPGLNNEVLPDMVVNFVVDLRDTDQCDVAAALVIALQESRLLSESAIRTWLGSTSAAQAQRVAEIVKEHLKL